jgi:SAM-dependent methyltransferase
MDYFNNPNTTHIIERDDGYLDTIETQGYYSKYDEWNSVEQKLAEIVEGKVLDVGCGSGRLMKYLQKKGINAVGIDISKNAIKATKLFGVKNCLVMDALNLEFPKDSFDTATLFCNGFGLCGLEGSRKMLQGLSKVVRPNGLLLASSIDPKNTSNPVHLTYHQRNRELGRPIGLVHIRVNFQNLNGDWFHLYLIEPEHVEDHISSTGWSLEKLIGADDQKNPFYGVVLRNSTC